MFTERIYNGTTLALDLASGKTGYAIYRNDKIIKSGTWVLKSQTRYADLYNNIVNTIDKYEISNLVIEDIFKDNDKPTAFQILAECRGIAECIAQLRRVPTSFIRPIAVKQHICGIRYNKDTSHRQYKDMMIRRITKLGYKLEKQNADDEADAIGLLITYLDNHNYIVKHPK